jgi:hypothetical protein
MHITLKTCFLGLTGLCLILAVFALVLDAGVHATPWDTADSQGRTMQFNDRFSAEHYRIALGHFRPQQLINFSYAYDWLLIGMLSTGMWCLWADERSGNRATRWFFFGQSALFFLGWLALVFLVWPQEIVGLFRCSLTREDFVDVPFTWVLSQPPWAVVSLAIAVALPGRSLGLKEAIRHVRSLVSSRL